MQALVNYSSYFYINSSLYVTNGDFICLRLSSNSLSFTLISQACFQSTLYCLTLPSSLQVCWKDLTEAYFNASLSLFLKLRIALWLKTVRSSDQDQSQSYCAQSQTASLENSLSLAESCRLRFLMEASCHPNTGSLNSWRGLLQNTFLASPLKLEFSYRIQLFSFFSFRLSSFIQLSLREDYRLLFLRPFLYYILYLSLAFTCSSSLLKFYFYSSLLLNSPSSLFIYRNADLQVEHSVSTVGSLFWRDGVLTGRVPTSGGLSLLLVFLYSFLIIMNLVQLKFWTSQSRRTTTPYIFRKNYFPKKQLPVKQPLVISPDTPNFHLYRTAEKTIERTIAPRTFKDLLVYLSERRNMYQNEKYLQSLYQCVERFPNESNQHKQLLLQRSQSFSRLYSFKYDLEQYIKITSLVQSLGGSTSASLLWQLHRLLYKHWHLQTQLRLGLVGPLLIKALAVYDPQKLAVHPIISPERKEYAYNEMAQPQYMSLGQILTSINWDKSLKESQVKAALALATKDGLESFRLLWKN